MKLNNIYINNYLDMLTYQKKYSKYTVINYKKDIEDYIEYLSTNNINIDSINFNEIENYLLQMYNLNLSKSTINRKLSSIRGLYKYLCEENILSSNPFMQISSPKKEKKLPNYLYTNEMNDLLNIEEKDIPLNERNELIIELLYDTGIRVSELVNIKICDINFDSKTIRILGKGQKERIVVFGEYALEKINIYINSGRLNLLKNKNCDYLILNNNGNQITTRGIRNIINLLTSKAHLKSHVTPHTLRHTFATHLLNEGADLTTVKELLGHKNLSTTSIYTHLSKEHLRNVYLNSHPRARKEK